MYGYQGEKGSGMNWEIGVDTYTLLILRIKEISKRTYCTAQRTLLSALWWLKWEGNPKRGEIYIQIANSLCCTVETNTKSQSNYVGMSAESLQWWSLFATLWTVALQAFCPWDSPGKNTGVDCHALLQGIFSTQGLNSCLLWLLHW